MSLKKMVFVLVLGILTNSVFSQDDQRPGCLDSLYIPASFVTCGDAITDAWEIYFPCAPKDFNITIYNRWGEEIYSSTDYKFRWKAEDKNGNRVETDVYVYAIEFSYLGEEKRFRGQVSYIR